ncbi:MAG: sulfite exporter TauE/SafE family protein [Chloroflexota bacterium]
MALVEFASLVLVATAAGSLGSMLGLGGGVFLVPVLTLVFDVPLRVAIAASAVSVVANSVSGSRIYLAQRYANIRLGTILLVTTSFGALAGGLIAVSLPGEVMRGIFATLLLAIAIIMILRRIPGGTSSVEIEHPPDPYRLAGQYADGPGGPIVRYIPVRIREGLGISTLAGVTSGMFGVGGGPLSVPMMNMLMRVPLKAAASTSSYMVGLTASVSALVYYNAGFVNPRIVVPAIFGIILGARIGVRVATRLRPEILVQVFIVTMIGLAILMYLDAFGVI